MLKYDRLQTILDITNREGSVSFQELCKKLTVSEDTIRRDIKELDTRDLLRAVRGGAHSIIQKKHHYRDREKEGLEEKRIIAEKALSLIRTDQVLFFDGGTSVLELTKILPKDLKVTIITNSFPVASIIEDHPSVELIFLGGRLYKSAFTTFGNVTLESITGFKADLYFFGVCSVTTENLYGAYLEDAEVKKAMIKQSKQIIGLCTSDKLDTESNFIIDKTSKLDIIITEKDNTSPQVSKYIAQGIEMI
ncbi:DeoR/GlpR family DNA-binding transcription regulator [Elizabethkingia ursingii]|jgi:DeoR/GlpR family transcriptional regulator of sugar metabolism|uniref:DeoR family transcriptional regulator n=1 Tax=Elizabethkingia ursingii TaxID=1756150 RepID=A0AAJ3NCV6_9FLAO|nr:DeoR/GlpR family DNA-binding transcription regulator [Elizabethkingia ursingii]AQX09922.1 DeoR family transcriptional regulator [Elizabethkingia ursingii]OPB76066.1 DeoR family transcriptional regulator [Elizabethkingia ursingii]